MANQLTIDSPEFDYIYREAGRATRDGIQSLWLVANDEAASRRAGVREAIERMCPKEIIQSPTASQNDYDTKLSTVLRFDGSTAINVTGFQARTEPTILFLFVLGSATITLKNESASSIDRNRILTFSGADLAIAQGKSVMLMYLNTRWREIKWA
ncbi:MAG: hypothetical protein EBT61_22275 [Verrucomicrobia bacterium]|nr:hypothetical protein [Verrucomicrobiota bacterium]